MRHMLIAQKGSFTRYYTGRAGDNHWLSERPEDAFKYEGLGEAYRKVDVLNKFTPLHGWVFTVVRAKEE